VHVPFCAQKCSYCAFYSEASNGETVNAYVEAVVGEMERVGSDLRPTTIFFGGGTPSILNLSQWRRILETTDRFGWNGTEEWTVECNPATVSLEKANLLRSHGVNRVSMGVQSLDETLLDRLGRIHTRDMVFRSFDILRKAGFQNINLDLMFGIPGQTMEVWRRTLDEALALQSEHVSTYEVIYEEDTPLFARLQAGEVVEDEELACDMYEELVARCGEAGLRQYEVANFARDIPPAPTGALYPGRACRHNVNYWRGGSFYGLGPSATSYVDGVRSKNWSNTRLYCEKIAQGLPATESSERLEPLGRAGETAAFGLRMTAGWPFQQFHEVTGFDLRDHWAADMEHLVQKKWGTRTGAGFALTPQGLRFADSAAQLFLR
jgi:oxygen-independent coproporphyrinogen-3 oxidase